MTELAAAIAVVGAALAAAYGNQAVITKTIESMTRQPEMSKELRTTMFIGVGMIEAMPIFAVIIALILVFVK
ncbi:F0F1 ATP synthase subunit C [Granulicatella seriolae]|uniref:ATP synthase subunit c n=1 Tax=Granulicatella seriolae TaxID=2967226 RepID=A0ABT1WL07_9LACT|nr:F0F1 ATP synthase subunit C [Granulicatella seriolae]